MENNAAIKYWAGNRSLRHDAVSASKMLEKMLVSYFVVSPRDASFTDIDIFHYLLRVIIWE